MDFPETDTGHSMQQALEQAAAQARLRDARTPDRFNENWRFGRPQVYAEALVAALGTPTNSGRCDCRAPEGCATPLDSEIKASLTTMHSLGSDKILALHLERFGEGVCLYIEGEISEPIVIDCETDSVYSPATLILAAEGARARIIERHRVRGSGTLVSLRSIMAQKGADISLELEVCGEAPEGDGPRAMNITNIEAADARVRQLTRYSGMSWAREETVATVLHGPADIELYSANRLNASQVLDQHTRQEMLWGRSATNLLYKNVIDDKATATFAGNIFVAPGAHETDAYQANRNMLLSENATVNSLPGLEILADHVRCSHGSASAPMDDEQLFYLCSRGIPRHEAQLLVAEGFLQDVIERFRSSGETETQAAEEQP